MSTRGLIIGIVFMLALAGTAALILRPSGAPEDRITIDGEPLTDGLTSAEAGDTAADPVQEYVRRLGPPDTSALDDLHGFVADSAHARLHEGEDAERTDNSTLPGPPIGAPAPEFSLPHVDGGTFSSPELRGRVAVLNFWATWCEPCRDEIPALITLQEDLRDEGLQIVGISIEDDSRKAVAEFTDIFPFNYPLLVEGRSVAHEYGADVTVPTTVLLDRRGHIVARLYGALHRDSLEAHVRPLLAD